MMSMEELKVISWINELMPNFHRNCEEAWDYVENLKISLISAKRTAGTRARRTAATIGGGS
jgi:hypothetical protein